MTAMTLGDHQEEFALDIVRLLTEATARGYRYRLGEFERTVEQQKLYVETGRSKTMESDHIKKCAADIHFFKQGRLCYPQELGDLWESMSRYNRWGGNWKSFKDAPHFERHVR